MSNKRSKVFRDAVHGLISIDKDRDLLLALIDTREFQRLRRIRQLGVSNLTYPNAEHTRFAHSLGVLHIAIRLIETLRRRHGGDDSVRTWLDGKERLVKIAALLHDLGHGPFSHMMERAFDAGKEHEKRSKDMFTDPSSGIRKVLQEHSITESQILEARNLLDFHEIPFLHDIISSSLDADRMDYLLRDSHFTGVAYGNYDLEWILNSFCLGLDPSPALEGDRTRLRLCLDEKRGQFAAEQLIIARVHLTMQVYTHRTTRMWEAHLLLLFAEATRLASSYELPPETPAYVSDYFKKKGAVSHEEFLKIDEPALLTCITIWSDSTGASERLRLLAAAFLERKRILRHIDLPGETRMNWRLTQIEERLESRGCEQRVSWLIDRYNFTPYEMPPSKLLTLDPGAYWEAVSENAIFLASGELDEKAFPIHRNSKLFKSLGIGKMPVCRLFYLPEIEESVKFSTQ